MGICGDQWRSSAGRLSEKVTQKDDGGPVLMPLLRGTEWM